MVKRARFSRWHSAMVKAKYDYTCAKCGSTENIQAHDPTGTHKNWRVGIALCGDCHSKEHPDVPRTLFINKNHQPYWPNISARSLAQEIKCHSRTIVRIAKKLGIPTGIPLSDEDKARIVSKYNEGKATAISDLPRKPIRFSAETLKRLKAYILIKYGSKRRVMSLVVEEAVKEYLAREEKRR